MASCIRQFERELKRHTVDIWFIQMWTREMCQLFFRYTENILWICIFKFI